MEKYSNLSENYHFVTVGTETFGAYGQVNQADWQKNTGSYQGKIVMQSISMAIQKGNAVCVRGCPKNLA